LRLGFLLDGGPLLLDRGARSVERSLLCEDEEAVARAKRRAAARDDEAPFAPHEDDQYPFGKPHLNDLFSDRGRIGRHGDLGLRDLPGRTVQVEAICLRRPAAPCLGLVTAAMLQAMGTPIQIAAAVIERDGRYLVARRPAGSHLEDTWEFPGGKREEGESLEECVRREVLQEIGVEVEVEGLRAAIFHRYPDREVLLHFYDCRLVKGVPGVPDGPELRWVSVEELSALALPEANRGVLPALGLGRRP
jgi:8-oxo-dGTP diphosphatase